MSDMVLVLVSAQTSAQMTFWAGVWISLALHDVSRDDRETQPNFEAMVCADGDFIYAAEVNEKSVSLQI